ncbi:amino acid ABC transporter permease, partial [Halobellus sp. Atlit-38R]
MAGATRPRTVGERVADADESAGRILLVAAGALFWGWLVVSWGN